MESKITKKIDNKRILDILIDYSPAIVLGVILLINIIITPNFMSVSTFRNIFIQVTSALLVALGMTWVIASDGIDISVGAVMALASMVSAKLIGLGAFPAIMIGLMIGSLSGVVAGTIIAKFKIQPIIVTIPLMIGVRGIAQIINDSKILRFSSDAYVFLGRYRIFGQIPIQIPIMIVIVGVMYFITNKMTFGRKIQALGDNKRASQLVGINTTKVIIVIYATCAFLASIAGVIETARISASDANILGSMIELDAIAAVAIGGTPMTGGKPNIVGTVFGAIIIQIITTMVNMNNIPFEYSLILKAIIIILALWAQRFLKSKR
ncbi:ABC transporter permease [Clostridium sp. DL1XJH146]